MSWLDMNRFHFVTGASDVKEGWGTKRIWIWLLRMGCSNYCLLRSERTIVERKHWISNFQTSAANAKSPHLYPYLTTPMQTAIYSSSTWGNYWSKVKKRLLCFNCFRFRVNEFYKWRISWGNFTEQLPLFVLLSKVMSV